MTPLQLSAFDLIRDRLTECGYSPLASEVRMALRLRTDASARSLIDALVRMGKLKKVRGATRNLELAGVADLRGVATSALRAELARRGVSLDALAEKPVPLGQGMPCAYEHCGERVGMGKLFCRTHWFAIPAWLRDRIFKAFRAKDLAAYRDAIEEARARIARGSAQVRQLEDAE